jgi:hypothetical protein
VYDGLEDIRWSSQAGRASLLDPDQGLVRVEQVGLVGGPQAGRLLGNGGPARFRRDTEADELVVVIHQLGGGLPVAKRLGEMADLVLEHVGEALGEDERQDVVLELRGVERPPDGAGRFLPSELQDRSHAPGRSGPCPLFRPAETFSEKVLVGLPQGSRYPALPVAFSFEPLPAYARPGCRVVTAGGGTPRKIAPSWPVTASMESG